MKINDNIMKMSTYKQIGRSDNVRFNSNSQPHTNIMTKDTAKFSMSGKASSKKITIPVRKVNTAGLIITDLKIYSKDKDGSEISIDKSIATVSNERSALGTSENRLGFNTKSIDNPPRDIGDRNSKVKNIDIAQEMTKSINKSILEQSRNMISIQANSSPEAVLQLLT